MTGRQGMTLVETIIVMAHALGKRVVAEGIETVEQLDFLRERRCDIAQGFFLARPGPPELLEQVPLVSGRSPGDPYVIREFMRQIGIPARIQ